MNRVIENILELSRRKAPAPSRLHLQSVLEEFVTQFRVAELEASNISIEVNPSSTEIRMDSTQLTQVLTNLAQNGLRYSLQETGTLTLRLNGGIDSTTDRPFLNVMDDGPGVAEDHRANLFEPFFTTERTGTGLGLYIAREMCEANQARLSYVQLAGRGACFRITFAHPDRITV
jgi:two-component system sensor histidine kinase PilS (NtrC family)